MGQKFFLDDVPPIEVKHVLSALRPGHEYTKDDITAYFDERSWSHQARFGPNTLGRLADLGILGRDKTAYFLTNTGEKVKNLADAQPESLFEYLHYTQLFAATIPGARPYFWTYWLLCCYITEHASAWNSNQAAGILLEKLTAKYGVDSLAIDGSSLNKMARWLKELSPSPVAADGRALVWRDEANPVAFTLGLSFYYRLMEIPYGYPILLTGDARQALRRIGFLGENGLDLTLTLLSKVSDCVRLHVGVSGMSMILEREVTVGDLLP